MTLLLLLAAVHSLAPSAAVRSRAPSCAFAQCTCNTQLRCLCHNTDRDLTGYTPSNSHLRASRKAVELSGVLNMPNVPSVAPFWPSADVQAVQSVRETTLKPFSHAVRTVLSTQQLVRKPPTATVSTPCFISSSSRSVPGKASKPFFPETTMSPSCGVICSQIVEFQVSFTNNSPSAQPLRMPSFLLGLSDMSAAKEMGV
mmetsp:Transcript_21222/g.41506  ORF Transcript_21222/g.41506 Transcript_21222/m.41506 type:complete len:200 (-) Transcript_21222:274-873(-)